MMLLIKYYVFSIVRPRHIALAIWLLAGIIGGMYVIPASFLTGSNVIIGFCLIPFVLMIDGKQRINYVYLVLVVLFAAVAWLYHVRMFYFFALGFYMLALIEAGMGSVNALTLFLLAFMSPFFHQVSVILGFPIRLALSSWAGQMLSLAGMEVGVEGNMMSMNGAAFTVDEACMGLNMLSTSLLMGVFIIAWQYRIQKKRVSFYSLTGFFVIVFCLNVFTNLMRIMVLVAFSIGPENPLHEIMGILCLIGYVIIPAHIIGRWLVSRKGIEPVKESEPMTFSRTGIALFTVMAIGMLVTGNHVHKRRAGEVFAYADARLDNFSSVRLSKGVTKIDGKDILVYVKPIAEFFSGEHTPLLCWQGSGYDFQHIRTITVRGKEVYCAKMVKPGAELFTAWWYSNGAVHTLDQFDWRIRMLKGEDKFCLINVSANDEDALMRNLDSILGDKPLIIYPDGIQQ